MGARGGTGGPYPAGSWGRLIVEVAIATHTSPADWRDEDEETVFTALEVLEVQANKMKRG